MELSIKVIAIAVILSILGVCFDLELLKIKRIDINSSLILKSIVIFNIFFKLFKCNILELNDLCYLLLLTFPTYVESIKRMRQGELINQKNVNKVFMKRIAVFFTVGYGICLWFVILSNISSIGTTKYKGGLAIFLLIALFVMYIGLKGIIFGYNQLLEDRYD